MRLTAWEEERLLVFTAAELARRHRAAGLRLNAPEAIALVCDAMFEAARAGESFTDIEAAGRAAVRPDDVLEGVRELVDEVRLEVLVGDGTRLVVLLDPLAAGLPASVDGPGAVRAAAAADEMAEVATPADAAERRDLTVRSASKRAIRVSSHFPFERVNARLEFDRQAARGFRLDIPAGASVRWAPGESKSVTLVRLGGRAADDGTATGTDS
jgi:urease subunit gamma/beta